MDGSDWLRRLGLLELLLRMPLPSLCRHTVLMRDKHYLRE